MIVHNDSFESHGVNDLALTISNQPMCSMLQIWSEYAKQYDILFNADK